jgi:transposase InsO family protein
MKLEFIKEHAGEYPLKRLCEALGVAPSAYHAWVNREPSARACEDVLLQEEIQKIYTDSRGRLGHRMMHRKFLKDRCGRDRVLRLMHSLDIAGEQPRSYHPQCTDSKHDFGYSPNLLKEQGPPQGCDEVWVTDTTYLKVPGGWVYLATVMDLCSRRILGWSVSPKNDTELVSQALENAGNTRGAVREGIIHHSDRGSTYASDSYQRQLERLGMRASMSARGNCYDNAAMESFYGRFKSSTIKDRVLSDEAEVRAVVFEYIEVFYNRYRPHSSLGYESPVEFEEQKFSSPPAGGEERDGGQAAFTE